MDHEQCRPPAFLFSLYTRYPLGPLVVASWLGDLLFGRIRALLTPL